ncbi:MAG TPA: hypothetical protein VK474_12305 [Chthoniobacterales bacterium]|nr:hypothetical protein [Chthoniobacterales bacterium]
MKTQSFLILSAVAAALQFAPIVSAQTRDGQDYGKRGRHSRMLANLSGEERAKLRAARQKAMADPALQAARDRQRQTRKEFRDLKRQKMLEADPSIQPILDKTPAHARRGR